MKKYEYVHIVSENNKATTAEFKGCREKIDEYAEKGYSYAGFVPSVYGPSGKLLELDLVFEIDE
ncbi:MAG: DUF4177 domain-containing protein [Oscillospiraceae bacterium]